MFPFLIVPLIQSVKAISFAAVINAQYFEMLVFVCLPCLHHLIILFPLIFQGVEEVNLLVGNDGKYFSYNYVFLIFF